MNDFFFKGSSQIAFQKDSAKISYDIFWKDVARACNHLESLSCAKGTLLGLQSDDSYRVWVYLLACSQLQLIALPINPTFSTSHIESIVSGFKGFMLLEDLNLNGSDIWEMKEPSWAKPWLCILTSGSTGRPKGVVHSLGSLVFSARSSLDFYEFSEGDSWVQSLGIYHIGGLMTAFRTLLGRGCLLMIGDPSQVRLRLADYTFNFVSLVPTQLHDMIKNKACCSSLRQAKAVIIGGAACPPSLIQRALDNNIPLSLSYGSSETGAQIAATKVGTKPLSDNHVGQLLPRRSAAIKDGVLVAEDGGCYLGYYGDSLIVAGTAVESQDLMTKHGQDLYINGRRDSVFQVGGENLSPEDLERRVSSFSENYHYLVLKMEHSRLALVPQLVLIGGEKPQTVELIEWLEDNLPKFERPHRIFWDDSQYAGKKLNRSQLQSRADSGDLNLIWEKHV